MSGLDPADEARLRDWYASIIARLDSLRPGDIIASWRGRFRPTGMPVMRTMTPAQMEARPEEFYRDDDGRWYGLLADAADADAPTDDPQENRPKSWTMFPARGGFAIRTADGRLFQDREAARAAGLFDAEHPPWVRQMVDDFVPSGRRSGVSPSTGRPWRRGVEPPNLARALLVASLAVRIGRRPAARLAIRWEAELGGVLADTEAAAAVQRYDRGELRSDAPKLEAATQTVLRDAYRVLATTGLRRE